MANQATTNVERARAVWGVDAPRYVIVLAEACDRVGRGEVMRVTGYSSSTITRILKNEYGARHDAIEQQIMGLLSPDVVQCPVFNAALPIRTCQLNRRRTDPPNNTLRRIYAAQCPTCLFNTDRKERP